MLPSGDQAGAESMSESELLVSWVRPRADIGVGAGVLVGMVVGVLAGVGYTLVRACWSG